MSLVDNAPRAPWTRSQKFVLSTEGLSIEAEYREKIVASRALEGRTSFDAARAAWAASHNLQPDDGLYLAEVRCGPVNMTKIIDALEVCGKSRSDALAAMRRLVAAGLVAIVDPRS